MKSRLNIFVLSFLLLLVVPVVQAQKQMASNSMDEKMAVELGQNAFLLYTSNAITERNAKDYGFESLKEAKSAITGSPLKVMEIQHIALKEYTPGGSIKTILNDPGILWFAVTVNGQTRTKLELFRSGDEWVPGEFGGQGDAVAISDILKRIPSIASSNNISGTYNVSLVRVPLFLASFVFIDSEQGEYLVPTLVQPQRLKLENGKAYKADTVLNMLKPIAMDVKEGTIR